MESESPSRATGAQFTYVRACDGVTQIPISQSRATSCACAQFLSACFVKESDNVGLLEIRFVSEVSTEERLARHRRHRISRHCARESAKEKERRLSRRCTIVRISDWLFYYRVKAFRIFCYVFLTTIVPSCMRTNTILFGCVAN